MIMILLVGGIIALVVGLIGIIRSIKTLKKEADRINPSIILFAKEVVDKTSVKPEDKELIAKLLAVSLSMTKHRVIKSTPNFLIWMVSFFLIMGGIVAIFGGLIH